MFSLWHAHLALNTNHSLNYSLGHCLTFLVKLFAECYIEECWEFLINIICWHTNGNQLCSPPHLYLLIINISSYFWKNNSLISHTGILMGFCQSVIKILWTGLKTLCEPLPWCLWLFVHCQHFIFWSSLNILGQLDPNFAQMTFVRLWKEYLNSDGHKTHQYQQNITSHLNWTHWTQKNQDVRRWTSWSWLGSGTKMCQGLTG